MFTPPGRRNGCPAYADAIHEEKGWGSQTVDHVAPKTAAATRSRAADTAKPSACLASATCPVISASCIAIVDSAAGTPSKLSRIW